MRPLAAEKGAKKIRNMNDYYLDYDDIKETSIKETENILQRLQAIPSATLAFVDKYSYNSFFASPCSFGWKYSNHTEKCYKYISKKLHGKMLQSPVNQSLQTPLQILCQSGIGQLTTFFQL